MNNLIFFLSIFIFLGLLILMFKLFGKAGLYAFVVFGTILANIQVTKTIDLFGFTTTAGSVLYASTFLCTDILSERYGKKSAKKAVYLGILTTIMWIIGTQVTLWLAPSSADGVQEHLSVIFGMAPRICIASLIAYVISQTIDVFMYHLIWKRTGNTKSGLWIRNNGSTLVSQAFDSVVFVTIAFIGTMPTDIFISVLVTTYLFKVIVALLDTPFAYLSRLINPFKLEEEENE